MKFINKFIAVAFFAISIGGLHAQTALEVYQGTAALNNPRIKSIFKQYEVVMQKVPQSSTLPDPTFGFGYFISATETRVGPTQAVMSISQSFPWFGKLGAQEQATSERALAVLERYKNERSKLNFDVANTYNSLYVLRSAVRITEENIALLNTFKDLANISFESGQGSMVDVLRIEMELDELKNQLAYLKDSKRPLTTEFEQLLNTDLEEDVNFPDVLLDEKISLSKELILDSVTTMNPGLRSLEHELLSYDQDVIAAQKAGGPSFTVGLNYTFVGEREGYTGSDNGRDAFLPTLGVKIPLYRKNYNSLVKEKEISKESVSLQKEDRVNVLETRLDLGFRDYDDGVRRIALYQELSDHANQAMDILIAEYTSADTNFEEIIRMDRKLLKYKLELEKARADQNTAVAYINYLMGK